MTIAASGPTDGSSIPVIVHNGLQVPVSRIDVTGDILDDAGRAVTTGHAQPAVPPVIPPGGIGLVRIYAGRDQLLDDAVLIDPVLTYATGSEEPAPRLALEVTDLTVQDGAVAVTITNSTGASARPPISVLVACLDAAGELTGLVSGTLEQDALDPGGSATLTLTQPEPTECSGQLAGAVGYRTDLLSLGSGSEVSAG